LAQEKGLHTLIDAWMQIGDRIPLKIVGDGPLDDVAEQAQERVSGVEWLGRKPSDEVYDLMGQAYTLIFPSEWYETFGRVAMEAFATGTPVIVSNLGGQAERVEHNRTGRLFDAGNAEDLVRQVAWALNHPEIWEQMGKEAREEFEDRYTADRNYKMLMDIYEATLHR
jgi:glycosyltransferase involved in cell wall biosynthesis